MISQSGKSHQLLELDVIMTWSEMVIIVVIREDTKYLLRHCVLTGQTVTPLPQDLKLVLHLVDRQQDVQTNLQVQTNLPVQTYSPDKSTGTNV